MCIPTLQQEDEDRRFAEQLQRELNMENTRPSPERREDADTETDGERRAREVAEKVPVMYACVCMCMCMQTWLIRTCACVLMRLM